MLRIPLFSCDFCVFLRKGVYFLMSEVNERLEWLIDLYYPDVYRLCFLLSCHGISADEIVFQTFLDLGSRRDPYPDSEATTADVYSCAMKTCDDFFLRRLRRRQSREQVQQSVAFPITDPLWQFLKLPVPQKTALFLCHHAGLSTDAVSQILHMTPRRLTSLLQGAKLPDREISAIAPDPGTAAQITDELFLRFEERSVGFENRLREIRLRMDRSIGWIALAILLVFAAAALYTAQFA